MRRVSLQEYIQKKVFHEVIPLFVKHLRNDITQYLADGNISVAMTRDSMRRFC